MRLEVRPLSELNPAAYNPRRDLQPGDPMYERLAKSYEEFGLVEPLVWNRRTGHLVGGHQRLKVLIERGVTETTVSVVDLPVEQEKALNIALNKIQGEWNESKLAELLTDLVGVEGLDIEVTGFDLPETDSLLAKVAAGLGPDPKPESFDQPAAEERALEQPVESAITKPGDILTLGAEPRTAHRLCCGDSTDPDTVRAFMKNDRAQLFATDPPYLVGYQSKSWDDAALQPDLYELFTEIAAEHALKPDAAWYCWHASRNAPLLFDAWERLGVLPHCQIIWDKQRPTPGRSWYGWAHEPCLMGWKQGYPPPRRADDKPSTVWRFPSPSGADRTDHPTPKPLELFEIPMRQHTRPGEICFDPFAGSGTQVIAAQRLGRRCFAIERDPRYCDLIVRRWIEYVGEAAAGDELVEKYGVLTAAREDAA